MEVLESMKGRLASLEKVNLQPTPVKTIDAVWEALVTHCFDCLVEGFAVDSCTNEGRAMMGIDLQNLVISMEKKLMLSVRAHAKYVEHYIKAYYTSDDELEKWIEDHGEYSKPQLTALVNCGFWDISVKRKILKNLNMGAASAPTSSPSQ
jgi:hypothetical protein